MEKAFDQAVSLYEAGDLAKAQELFANVDKSGADLGWVNNTKLRGYLTRIPQEIESAKAREAERKRLAAAARVDAESRLSASRKLLASQRFDEARENALAVGEMKALADDKLKAEAENLIAGIGAAEQKAKGLAQERAMKAEKAYKRASVSYKAEDYVSAKADLKEALSLKDALSARQQSTLASRLSDIDDRVAQQLRIEKKRREAALARERDAETLHRRAKAAMAAKQYTQAREMLSRLRSEYKDTEFVKTH